MKDIWFYVRDFLIKTPVFLLLSVAAPILVICSLMFLTSGIALVVDLEGGDFGEFIIFDKKDIINEYYFYKCLAVCIVGFTVSLGLIFLLKWVSNKINNL